MIFLLSTYVFATPRAEFVRAVLEAHPAVAAAELRVRGADRDVAGVATLDPLMVSVGVAPFSLAADPGVDIDARWTLPRLGMARAARDAATARAAELQADGAMGRSEVAAVSSILVDTLWELDRTASILAHLRELLVSAVAALDRRVAAGLAMPDAAAMARMELVELEVEELMLARRRAQADAEVRALQVAAPIVDGDPGPVLGSPPSIVPAVAAARASASMARSEAAMVRREGLPMVDAMAGWSSMWEEEMHRTMVGLGVTVPLDFAARRGRLDAASFRADAAERDVTAAERTSAREVARAQAMVDEAQAMTAAVRERLHPLSVQRAALTRTAYETGTASLADWLDAEREAAHVQIRIATATADLHRAEAMLAFARGELAGLPGETP